MLNMNRFVKLIDIQNMGKSYKGNSEFGRKFKDQRKSKNKDCGGKNNRRTKQSDDQFMKSDQFES